jgi:hypothetical protein
MDDS